MATNSRRDEIEVRFLAYLAVQVAQAESVQSRSGLTPAIDDAYHADRLVRQAQLVVEAARRAVAGGAS